MANWKYKIKKLGLLVNGQEINKLGLKLLNLLIGREISMPKQPKMKSIPKGLRWVEVIIWELYNEGKIKDDEILDVDLSLRCDKEQKEEYLKEL